MSTPLLKEGPKESRALAPPILAEAADSPPHRSDPLFHQVFLAMAVGVLLLSFLLNVRSERYVVLPFLGQPLPEMCALKRQTGVGCPGCGLTRSFISIARGDIQRAWRFNPAGPFFFGIVVFQLAYRPYQLARIRAGRPEFHAWWLNAAIWLLVSCLILQWVVRLTMRDWPL